MDWHYLDHAAGSPARPEVVAALVPLLSEGFGNPSGAHALARAARAELDDARGRLAAVVGCEPGELVFTSGGTEADDLAVRGTLGARPGVAVCSAVEHHAVLHPVARAAGVTVPVDRRGVVDLDALAEALHPEVALVSVVLVNNEVGTIQPLSAIAEVVRERAPRAVLHTDASQALSWLDLRVHAASADLVTLASHKCGGPKGVGALVVRHGVRIEPQLIGGGQERERRSGTQHVAGAVGFAVAAEQAAAGAGRAVGQGHRAGGPDSSTRCSPAVDEAVDSRRAGGAARRPPGAGHRQPVPPRGRQRGAALPPRARPPRAGRGRIELRQRRTGSVARAGRDGDRPLPGPRLGAALGGVVHHGRRRRRRGGRRPRRGPPSAVPRAGRDAGVSGSIAVERVLVAMSGGVDSSVAAALLLEAGHDVVGVTLKLWGGDADKGCCSVADVDDARTVAARLGIEHHVFNFGDDFDAHVVAPYLADHAAGRTPNPCIECNRHLKFDRLLRRADALGFEAVATGHHARIVPQPDGTHRVARGADPAKDQSYVVHMLDERARARVRFPVGHLTKDQVRAAAARAGLVTADKPDSQDVCFITATGGREAFLGDRIALRPGRRGRRDRSHRRRGGRGRAGHHRPAPRPRPVRRGSAPVRQLGRRAGGDGHRRRQGQPARGSGRPRAPVVGGRADLRPTARAVQRPRRPDPVPASSAMTSCSPSRPGGWRPARPSCSTTATRSSAPAPLLEGYAPTVRRMPRVCVSRRRATWLVSDRTRSAWASPWPASPQAGVMSGVLAQQDGVAAALGQRAPLGGEVLPEPLRRGAERAGRGDGTPGQPAAALEEGTHRAGVHIGTGVDGQRQDLRTGLEDDAPVSGPAAVQAGDRVRLERGQRARDEVDRAVGVEREPRVHRSGEPGLVDEDHERRHRRRLLRGGDERAGPRPDGGAGDREGSAGRARRGRGARCRASRGR